MIIAVDFDGTIVESNFPWIGPAYPQALNFLRQWKRKKHKLILWTCRDGQHLNDAVQFCRDQGIEFDAINDNIRKYYGNNSRKVWADLYVDDKCGLPIDQVWTYANKRVREG